MFYQNNFFMAEAHFQFSDKMIACGSNCRARAGDLCGLDMWNLVQGR